MGPRLEREQREGPGWDPFLFLRQSPGRSPPSGHREGRTSQKRKGAGTWGKNSIKNQWWNHEGRKGLKGLQWRRGFIPWKCPLLWILMALEFMAAARHLHAGFGRGSRQAAQKTQLLEADLSPGRLFPFRRLPHPRNREAASTVRVSGAGSHSEARRRKR